MDELSIQNSKDTSSTSNKIGEVIFKETIPLVLKYIAGGVILFSLWELVQEKLVGADTYLVYVSSILTTIGVTHVLSKKVSNPPN